MSEQLLVLLYDNVVGTLHQPSLGDDPTFTYLPEYARGGSAALSARLPLSESTYTAKRVAPFLSGLLPENRELRSQMARELGTHEDDYFTLLSHMGWDCPGAVQFCRPTDVQLLRERTSEYAEIDESGIAARLRSLTGNPASWLMPDEHWSLGGQQEKFALAEINGRWHEAHGSAATTHIFKPGIPSLHHQALVEHVTMMAASHLGVDIAGTRMLQFEDQWAIVVGRFDRSFTDDNHVVRLHQEDFCQALGRMPSRKYESNGGPTLADMVRTVEQHSTERYDDRIALADFLIINVVAGAPDGHSKNISMLRLPNETSVAPLYDLATGLAYETQRVERSTALSVGGERELSRIYKKQWIKAADILKLDGDAVVARTASLASGFPAAFETALVSVEHIPGANEVADRTLPELRSHCERIIDRL